MRRSFDNARVTIRPRPSHESDAILSPQPLWRSRTKADVVVVVVATHVVAVGRTEGVQVDLESSSGVKDPPGVVAGQQVRPDASAPRATRARRSSSTTAR